MIFPCGLPDRGKKKNEKKFAITKIVLIFVVLFGFRAVLHCFGCPFLTKNRMFECFLSHTTIQTQGNIKHFCVYSPYDVKREDIVRGLLFFVE